MAGKTVNNLTDSSKSDGNGNKGRNRFEEARRASERIDESVDRYIDGLLKRINSKPFFVCWRWYFENPDNHIKECSYDENVQYQYYYHINATNASEAKKQFLLERYKKEWLDAEKSELLGALEYRGNLKKESVRYLIEAICDWDSSKGYVEKYECRTKDIHDKYLAKCKEYEEYQESILDDHIFDEILDDLDVESVISEMAEEDVKELYLDAHHLDVIALPLNTLKIGDTYANKLGDYSSCNCSEK